MHNESSVSSTEGVRCSYNLFFPGSLVRHASCGFYAQQPASCNFLNPLDAKVIWKFAQRRSQSIVSLCRNRLQSTDAPRRMIESTCKGTVQYSRDFVDSCSFSACSLFCYLFSRLVFSQSNRFFFSVQSCFATNTAFFDSAYSLHVLRN